jgi:hypothetical protein
MRQGCIRPGAYSAWRGVWTDSGEEIASADFTAHMGRHEGRLRIHMDAAEQTIFLTPRPRRFGGRQWYFVCPIENRCCSVLFDRYEAILEDGIAWLMAKFLAK